MKTLAAILVQTGQDLILDEITIPPLQAGQCLVKILYSGVCHTQILEARGYRGEDKFLPHLLGHEGVGEVVEIGSDVKNIKKGELVVLSWIKGQGANVPGTQYDWNGKTVNSGAITTFSHYSVISENRLSPLDKKLDLKTSALVGCAAATGMGALLNTGEYKDGEKIAIIGLGGVGLMALQAALSQNCPLIIAVDRLASKLKIASEMGAHHTIDASQSSWIEEVLKIIPSGPDVIIEATGVPQVMAQALECVKAQGGRTVILGNAPFGQKIEFNPSLLNQGKQLRGSWGGDSVPQRDYPKIMQMMKNEQLDFSQFIKDVYPLEKINEAITDLEQGKVLRPLIKMPHA